MPAEVVGAVRTSFIRMCFIPMGTVARGKIAGANRRVAAAIQVGDSRRGPSSQSRNITRMTSEQRDPFERFDEWFKAAAGKEPNEPNAMALATVAADGMPSLRMVLLKGVDDRGFVFYTNYEGRK